MSRTIIILLSIFSLALGIYLVIKGKKLEESQESQKVKVGNFTGLISGTSMALSGVILLLIVLVGGVVLLVIYGGAKVAKSASQDPDKAIERTVKLSEAVKNIRK